VWFLPRWVWSELLYVHTRYIPFHWVASWVYREYFQDALIIWYMENSRVALYMDVWTLSELLFSFLYFIVKIFLQMNFSLLFQLQGLCRSSEMDWSWTLTEITLLENALVAYSDICLEDERKTRKTTKNSVITANNLAEIWVGYIPNASAGYVLTFTSDFSIGLEFVRLMFSSLLSLRLLLATLNCYLTLCSGVTYT
jgi:hypothetical protein